MTYGTVTSVEADELGSALLADAAIGATVLAVDFTADFTEDGGTLMLNGDSLAYTTIDPVAHTITLSAALVTGASADDPVLVVDAGKVAVEWIANVATDEGDTVSAVIPTPLIGFFTEGTYDEPITVALALRGDTYEVTSQPVRDAAFDGATVWNPRTTQAMSSVSIPDDGDFHQITSWTTTEVDGLVLDDGVNIVYDGTYLFLVRVAFASNSSGRRAARILLNGTSMEQFISAADSGGTTYVPVFASIRCLAGDKVTISVFQSSGAGLSVTSGSLNAFRVSS